MMVKKGAIVYHVLLLLFATAVFAANKNEFPYGGDAECGSVGVEPASGDYTPWYCSDDADCAGCKGLIHGKYEGNYDKCDNSVPSGFKEEFFNSCVNCKGYRQAQGMGYGQKKCEKTCGSSIDCDETFIGSKGNCEKGKVCNQNCECEDEGKVIDSDDDGVPDDFDKCDNTPLFSKIDIEGCTTGIVEKACSDFKCENGLICFVEFGPEYRSDYFCCSVGKEYDARNKKCTDSLIFLKGKPKFEGEQLMNAKLVTSVSPPACSFEIRVTDKNQFKEIFKDPLKSSTTLLINGDGKASNDAPNCVVIEDNSYFTDYKCSVGFGNVNFLNDGDKLICDTYLSRITKKTSMGSRTIFAQIASDETVYRCPDCEKGKTSNSCSSESDAGNCLAEGSKCYWCAKKDNAFEWIGVTQCAQNAPCECRGKKQVCLNDDGEEEIKYSECTELGAIKCGFANQAVISCLNDEIGFGRVTDVCKFKCKEGKCIDDVDIDVETLIPPPKIIYTKEIYAQLKLYMPNKKDLLKPNIIVNRNGEMQELQINENFRIRLIDLEGKDVSSVAEATIEHEIISNFGIITLSMKLKLDSVIEDKNYFIVIESKKPGVDYFQIIKSYEFKYLNLKTSMVYCKSLLGPDDAKFKVLILGKKYSSSEQFLQHAQLAVEGIQSFEPFKSNFDKFQFKIGDYRTIDETYAKMLCDTSYTIILQKTEGRSFADPSNKQTVIYTDALIGTVNRDLYIKAATIHEFGHIFAGLWDEYEEVSTNWLTDFQKLKYNFAGSGPNCAENEAKARSMWSDLEFTTVEENKLKIGYYKGCFNGNKIKPLTISIMYMPYLDSEDEFLKSRFGAVSERCILKILDRGGGTCMEGLDKYTQMIVGGRYALS